MGARRLFVAVKPPAEQVAELEDFLDTSGVAASGIRLVHPEKWHITLSFMPHSTRTESLQDALTTLASRTPPLEIALRGAGLFAGGSATTPIWVGVEGDLAALEELATACRGAAHRAGIRVDSPKRFRPHLTLARRPPPEHAALWMDRLAQFGGTTWVVRDIVLVESWLGGRGTPARHEVLQRHRLTG